ncbi:hypothetical protein ACFQ5B_06860, partial [Laceyella putida]|uniref:hypothetical protein n=1 Tax=Laceyella putida TaxID=110101 RepID=UPI003637A540
SLWTELFLMFWSFNIVFTQFSVTKKVPEGTFTNHVMLLHQSLIECFFIDSTKKAAAPAFQGSLSAASAPLK